jgi:hypothetical protein
VVASMAVDQVLRLTTDESPAHVVDNSGNVVCQIPNATMSVTQDVISVQNGGRNPGSLLVTIDGSVPPNVLSNREDYTFYLGPYRVPVVATSGGRLISKSDAEKRNARGEWSPLSESDMELPFS